MIRASKKLAGFTLIETIVAIFVLSIGLSGAFTVLISNLQTSRYIKNVFIANGLAQEGLEVIRNIRDTDWHLDNLFGTFGHPSGTPLYEDGLYRIQYDSRTLLAIEDNTVLKKSADGKYSYDTADESTDTIFHRSAEIRRVSPPSGDVVEIIVTVRVSWDERFGTREVSGEQHLYDWYTPRLIEL